MKQVKSRLFFLVISLAALGFVYSSGAGATHNGTVHKIVLHGIDGGTINGDSKFAWDQKCVDTQTKIVSTSCSAAPTIGYLYKGPINGAFIRTGTCWNRSPLSNKEVACSSATGFLNTSFSHHGFRIEGGGIQGGDITVILGEIDPNNQLISVVPGAVGTPTVVTISMPDVLVKGYLTEPDPDVLVGQAHFSFVVVFTIPVATDDKDNGHGNSCSKCDPNNPGKKGSSCTGCAVNQTCTDLGGGESQFAVRAFCVPGNGVTVAGELKLLAGQQPPKDSQGNLSFPGCTADTCILKVGGSLPTDSTACAQIFDEVIVNNVTLLAVNQMLSFQQNYVGACNSTILADFGLESPVGTKLGLHRECHSDAFDGVDRGCFVVGTALHVVEGGEAARFTEVTTNLSPESVNLRCDLGKDSGIAKVAICTTAEFNALDTDTGSPAELPFLIVQGDTFCSGKPCPVPAIPGSATQADVCGDFSTDRQFSYLTCNADGISGLSQAIRRATSNAAQAGDLVPVTLQGTAGNGTVVIQGTDDAKVVNP